MVACGRRLINFYIRHVGSLNVSNLSAGYDQKTVVSDCSFQVENGEVLVVLGESGDGKSTLMKALAGLIVHQAGKVFFNDEPVPDAHGQLVPGHPLIKLINQDFQLDEFHTVAENIRLRLLAFDKSYQADRVRTLLRITKLTRFKSKKAADLSGGQKQRLAIARALADEPEFLLLDEPFNQLDFQMKQGIARHIRNYIKSNGIGAIMVTHNGVEAMEWADRIMHLSSGRILRMDSAEHFYQYPTHLNEARFFGPVNKVVVENGNTVYFRPEDFRLKAMEEYRIPLAVAYKKSVLMGWYSVVEFQCLNRPIQLYSTKDLSGISKIFVKKLPFSD